MAARGRVHAVGLCAAGVAVAVPYALSLASPPRFSSDSFSYLGLAGGLHLPEGLRSGFPPGYPTLLSGLDDLGLATPTAFVALNLLFLAAGLIAVYFLCRREFGFGNGISVSVCLATLLSYLASTYSAIPLSDLPFFGVAMACLLALSHVEAARGRERAVVLGLAVALCAAGIALRTAGIALAPPVLFVALRGAAHQVVARVSRRRRSLAVLLVAGCVALAGAALVAFAATSPYAHDVGHAWRLDKGIGRPISRLGSQTGRTFVSAGEVATQADCCARISPSFKPALGVAGAAALALVAVGLRARRRWTFVEVFLLSTIAVILISPNGQPPRLWLPALPLGFAYGLLGLRRLARRWPPIRVAGVVYGLVFAAAGVGWMASSVRLTFAGDDFLPLWARKQDRVIAASYRVAYGRERSGDRQLAIPVAVRILRRYVHPRHGE